MRLRRQRASTTQADFAGTVCQGGSQAFGSTAGKGGVPGIWRHSRQRRRPDSSYGVGVPGIWQHSMPGKRPGHWTAEQAKEAGEASPGIARRRRGIAGGMRGRGCPAGHFLHCRHPAMTQVRRLRLTPPASPSSAFRALCVPGLPGLPCSPCFPLRARPVSVSMLFGNGFEGRSYRRFWGWRRGIRPGGVGWRARIVCRRSRYRWD